MSGNKDELINRRMLLGSVSALAAGVSAGCSGGASSGDRTETDVPDDESGNEEVAGDPDNPLGEGDIDNQSASTGTLPANDNNYTLTAFGIGGDFDLKSWDHRSRYPTSFVGEDVVDQAVWTNGWAAGGTVVNFNLAIPFEEGKWSSESELAEEIVGVLESNEDYQVNDSGEIRFYDGFVDEGLAADFNVTQGSARWLDSDGSRVEYPGNLFLVSAAINAKPLESDGWIYEDVTDVVESNTRDILGNPGERLVNQDPVAAAVHEYEEVPGTEEEIGVSNIQYGTSQPNLANFVDEANSVYSIIEFSEEGDILKTDGPQEGDLSPFVTNG